MKKLALLAIVSLCCIGSFAQSNYYKIYKGMKGEPIGTEDTSSSQWHLRNYEVLSRQSGYFRYGALGCMAASVGCFAAYASLDVKFKPMFEDSEKTVMRRCAKNYLIGGAALAAVALICEAVSIDCRIKADKSMKIYATGAGAGLALNF